MYLKCLVFLSLALFLEANNEQTKVKEEREFSQSIEDSNNYILASTMYNIKDYQKSYELFFNLFLKDSYNININYFLALSAVEIKKYDEATAAFERVLNQKPDFHQARYEYAKLLYFLKLNDEAKREFLILSNSNITDDTKKSVSKYLEILEKDPRYLETNAVIMLGVGRSTNINNGLISPEEWYHTKAIADNYHNEMVGINFLNSFKNPSYGIKNSLMVYNKNYFSEENENITAYSYKPSFYYLDQDNKNLYSLVFGFTRIDKRDNENFNIFSITPTFSNNLFTTSFSLQKISYLHEIDEGKDFNKYEFLLKYNILENLAIYSKMGKNKRLNDERIDLDKNIISLGFEYTYLLNENNLIKFNSEYVNNNYKYENDFFESKREDNNYFTEISYLYRINKENQIILSTSYTKNNSNQDAYVYEEVDGKINYIKLFNW